MTILKHIDINLLKTRLEELLTGGRGDQSQSVEQHQNVESESARVVSDYLHGKKESSTTLSPLSMYQLGLSDGIDLVKDCCVASKAFKSSANIATTLKPEEKMSEGKKYDEQKPKMILLSPTGLEEEAKVMTFGAKKYGDYNWRKGIAVSRYVSAALRHLVSVTRGDLIDNESGLSHLAHAKANLGMAIQTLEDYPELNDLYKKE